MTQTVSKSRALVTVPPPAAKPVSMFDKLPPPPEKIWNATAAEVMGWLRDCAEAAGSAGLMFAFNPKNWPGRPAQRTECWGWYGQLLDETIQREKFEAEQRAAEDRRKAVAADEAARAGKGWQKWAAN